MKNSINDRLIIGLFMVVTLILGVCAINPLQKDTPKKDETHEIAGMANPWTDYENIEKAKEGTGIEINITENVIEKYGKQSVRGMGEEIIEIDAGDISIRKGKMDVENLAGDFRTYEELRQMVATNGAKVNIQIKGGKAVAATWEDGEFRYAISENNGMRVKDMMHIVNHIL